MSAGRVSGITYAMSVPDSAEHARYAVSDQHPIACAQPDSRADRGSCVGISKS